ncbi:PDxFFG protein [Mesomycoplasma ovipneumoniae]|uniref:PDxFFG protein n=1 Tax=Mesomycoplasma ovipneumoniae TaxID=29562 RepID=A0AAW6Q453_9BACT|nr:PDxFFG protein [Mesomycoplasma ovipneumoniae]MDF9627518.1 PDxFFG protein [Mesomycoplasma ovipneumoniae]MDO4158032.1 PDxFFG protein [Mesomycoplasma ovipneumoniae]MDO4158458.1 PDxFFG protein [Mesomycoplasma ovipneumoniae]MDO6821882.1 PDxFFG protein [Mesomycoplasma ovipneumoniae]MDO6855744.1 PDxFFG protein [Mesomycoplasma ovipneumoniae]
MKKTSILVSYLLAGGGLTAAVGGIMGGIKLYANNNELGVYNLDVASDTIDETKQGELVYANFYNAQGENVAEFKPLEGDKDGKYGIFLNPKIKSEKRVFTESEFADWFALNYNRQTPIFELKLGVMKFVNEYWDAISPSEFLEYAKWFTKNVAWGPDALTLEHFALKKGVTRSGNNLLLGQHSAVRKEEARIEFFPDSFFGSFPIYSELAGRGNAPDNLTYKIFEDAISKEALDEYFKKIPQQQVLANYDKSKVVAGIPATDLVKNEKIYLYDIVKILKDTFANDEGILAKLEKIKGPENFFVFENEGQTIEDVKKKFELAALMFAHENDIQLPKNYSLNFPQDFEKTYKIRDVSDKINSASKNDDNNVPRGILSLDLEGLETDSTLEDQTTPANAGTSIDFQLTQNVNPDISTLIVAELATKISQKVDEIVKNGFYDLYNINHPVGKTIGIYQKDSNNRLFFPLGSGSDSPSIEAQNEYLSEFDANLWSAYQIKSLKKLSKTELEVELIDSKDPEIPTKTIKFNLDPQDANYAKNVEEFNSFKIAVDWKNRAIPKVIQEIETLKDGKTTTVYQLYGEIFDGLIDKVLRDKLTNGEDLVGTYVDFEIDQETGLKKYTTKHGEFVGYSHSSRIPYIALLKASSPFFKTTGINYLKYVGAHEYGHHQTLNYAQDNSDPDSNVVLNAISTNAGLGLQSFYNFDVLQLYLNARSSGLSLRKASPSLNPEDKGIYPNFSFDSENNFESESQIFGAQENQDLDKLISKKSRRFLQTIDGLKTAADIRKLKLYDLFLLNSIDPDSGTINPGISGASKFFRNRNSTSQENTENESDQETKKQKGFINSNDIQGIFANSLTDGAGNKIQFDDQGKIHVADFEVGSDRRTFKNLKVHLFYENGKPVIDPLTFNNPESLGELQQKIKQIQDEFENKIVKNFRDNGWDSSAQSFARFSPSSPDFEKTLNSILHNPVENQAFFGSIIGNNPQNLKASVEIPDSVFDLSKFLIEIQLSPSVPDSVANLAKELLEKEKTAGFRFLDFFKLFKGVQTDSSNEISKAFQDLQKTLDLGNRLPLLLNAMLSVSSQTNSDLHTNLNNISTFKDSLFSKIPQVVSFLETLYTIYFRTLVQALSKNGTSSDQAARILTRAFTLNLNSELYKNLDKIIKFTDQNGQNVSPRQLFVTLENFNELPQTQQNNLSILTNGPIFASSYFGKIISVNGNQYYQNPKYDFYTGVQTQTKIDNVLDQSEFDHTKQLSERWTSPLGNLLKFSQVSVQKPLFGIAEDFKFNVSGGQIDNSKIYLDAWDKTVFGFDYENNYFAYQNEKNETEFSSISDFLEFISIDPFALKISKKSEGEFVRDWNFDYVNSKFDLYKYSFDKLSKNFKLKENQTENSMPKWTKGEKFETKYQKLLSLFDISEEDLQQNLQNFANTLMEAFEQSTLNLLIKNTKIDNKNIDHLFLSSVGFMGFKNFARKTRPTLPATKFGKLTNFDRIVIGGVEFAGLDETNSLVLDEESFVDSDLNDSEKSEVFRWIKGFLAQKNIDASNLDLFKLQYLVGTKTVVDYTIPSLFQRFQWMNTDLELSWLRAKNSARFETRPDDFFSNYVYNFPESLTRDFIQIHYSPSDQTLDNIMPGYKNISESNTGNEYFVDAIYTRKWIRNFIPAFDIAQGYSQTLLSPFTNFFLTNSVTSKNSENLNSLYKNLTETFKKAQDQELYNQSFVISQKEQQEIAEIETQDKPQKFIDQVLANIENQDEIQKIKSKNKNQKDEIFAQISVELSRILSAYKGELADSKKYSSGNIQPVVGNFRWRNGYINQNVSTNNGFFKDRFQRKVLNWELYDDNLEPVEDNTIRITNLKGEKVTNRPEAFWYYSLKTQGVGQRSLSGIWRDSKQDRVAFWGFLKNEDAEKAKYLTLEDEQTGQKFYIKLASNATNNIFYLKKQADLSTKWTLKDEGYSSWISSWSIIGEFKNALLRPGAEGLKKFRIYFSDQNRQEIEGLFTLGKSKYLAENGKNFNLAPTYIEQKANQSFLVIRPQFK